MQSVSFTTTVRLREPCDNIVDLDAYRRELSGAPEVPEAVVPAPLAGSRRQGGLRRRLQDLALLLEICVGFSMLALIFVTLFRLLF